MTTKNLARFDSSVSNSEPKNAAIVTGASQGIGAGLMEAPTVAPAMPL